MLRILIADDHTIVRRGLKALIESQVGWTVCAEASNGREAVQLAEKLKPDLVVLDLTMPELNGIDAARRILGSSNRTEILLLSVHFSVELVREAMAAGIRGYVLKTDADNELISAIEALGRHKPFFTSIVMGVILEDDTIESATAGGEDQLTSREREIVQLIAEGKDSKDVAVVLNLSVKTVETHRSNVMKKLKIHRVSDLVRYAVRKRLVEP